MRKIKGFSFDPTKDIDVIEHINNQPNGSQYVWGLVRQDMNNTLEQLVKKIIEKQFKGYEPKPQITGIDKNDIADILNL